MEPFNEKREKLKEFYFRIKNCRNCQLSGTRINFVFGSGNANTSILFIGEAPGKNEDLQGRPFVGQAGKILDDLLAGIGISRNEVFIANVLKCRPPANRDPFPTEIDTCKPYLFEQIKIIDPAIICTLGKYSTQLILETTEGITKLRGNIFKINGRLVLPINHPAAALYAPSRISVLKQDFDRIKSVLDKQAESGGRQDLDKHTESGVRQDLNKQAESGGRQDLAEKAAAYGRQDLDKKAAAGDKDGSNKQACLEDSELSDEREITNKNMDDRNQNTTNQNITNQDNIKQQLGLF